MAIELDAFSPQRPLILLTDFRADALGGSAVIIRSLLKPHEHNRILWFTMATGGGPSNPSFWDGQIQLRTSAEVGGPMPSALAQRLWRANRWFDRLMNRARETRARAIWLALHGDVLPLASRLADRNSYPYHATVHDDPAYATTIRSRRSFFVAPIVEQELRNTLRHAKSVDVISPTMGKRYQASTGVSSTVVHRGVEPSAISPGGPVVIEKVLSVGILGNLYSPQQIPSLGYAVRKAAAQLGVSARIVILGESKAEGLVRLQNDRLQVQSLGHVAENEAVVHLQRCLMLYLNYPFSRICRVLRQTSFPTKLSTYIMAARPILLHAPSDSSTTELQRWVPFVTPWTDMNVERGAALLVEMFKDEATFGDFRANAEEVRQSYFDPQTNRARLLNMLNALAE